MTPIQEELIKKIADQLQFGDNKIIAKAALVTPQFAGRVLNVKNKKYSQKVVDAALVLIAGRNKAATENLNAIQ